MRMQSMICVESVEDGYRMSARGTFGGGFSGVFVSRQAGPGRLAMFALQYGSTPEGLDIICPPELEGVAAKLRRG